jgi:hypothetical protein
MIKVKVYILAVTMSIERPHNCDLQMELGSVLLVDVLGSSD